MLLLCLIIILCSPPAATERIQISVIFHLRPIILIRIFTEQSADWKQLRAWQSGYIFKNYDRIPSRPTSTNSHRNCALIVCEKIQYENTLVRWWVRGGGGLEIRAYALTYNNRCCADRRRRRHANRHRRFNLSAAITPGCTHIIIIIHIVLTMPMYFWVRLYPSSRIFHKIYVQRVSRQDLWRWYYEPNIIYLYHVMAVHNDVIDSCVVYKYNMSTSPRDWWKGRGYKRF